MGKVIIQLDGIEELFQEIIVISNGLSVKNDLLKLEPNSDYVEAGAQPSKKSLTVKGKKKKAVRKNK